MKKKTNKKNKNKRRVEGEKAMAAMFVEFLFLVARPFPRLFASLSLSFSVRCSVVGCVVRAARRRRRRRDGVWRCEEELRETTQPRACFGRLVHRFVRVTMMIIQMNIFVLLVIRSSLCIIYDPRPAPSFYRFHVSFTCGLLHFAMEIHLHHGSEFDK